jgi:hypothetical protein
MAGSIENWTTFRTKVVTLMNSRGHDFLSSVSFPEPLFDSIEDWYTVPVTQGPAGYTTRHGTFHEFQVVGQPAK